MNTIQEIENLRDEVARLKAMVQALSSATQPHPGNAFRIATIAATGTPPLNGLNIEAEFQNGTYTKGVGSGNDPTFTKRQTNKEWISNLNGGVPPEGQQVPCVFWSGRWWAMTSTRIFGVVKTAAITPGGSGTIAILKGGVETTENRTVWLKYMHNNEQISVGKQVLVDFFPYETSGERWIIIGAECET